MKKRQIKKTNSSPRKATGKAVGAGVPIDGPTPEQAARVVYNRGAVRDEAGRLLAMAYRREPLFETMAKKGTIAPDELQALRYYRSVFDRSERSATKSCLNIGQGGMRGPADDIANATSSMIDAKRRLRICEAVLGPNLHTLRAIALEDRSISEVAIERFGSRQQNWIIVDEPVLQAGRPLIVDGVAKTRPVHHEKIVPKSGRHRAVIAAEFRAGIEQLSKRLRNLVNMKDAAELWIEVHDDGRAELATGICAPAIKFRWWGSGNDVAEVFKRARDGYSSCGTFLTYDAALKSVQRANESIGWRLQQLEPEELAA